MGPYLVACTNTACDFHNTFETAKNNPERNLPVFEVDEIIYKERPSLLFSTVDKFVQLAWKNECFNLFNIEFNNGEIDRLYPSPELIIQDELHLISSALGTVYGVYEIVVDALCKEKNGIIPKIIGATATVRNAEKQCKRLYARKHFLQFPPPAFDADDSFYAQKIKGSDPTDRLYIGFMPSGITTSTALIRLASVLLERIPIMPVSNEDLDNYYTLIIYFNALKELGKFRTFLTDDIVAYRKLLANHFKTFIKPFNNNTLCELSSVMTSDEITTGLDKLEKTTLPKNLEANNLILNKLIESGIRTFSDLRNARGSLWSEVFIKSEFFIQNGLNFTGDFNTDIKSFVNTVNSIIPNQSDPIQIATATNMISVGVDIPRLNVMVVNGQPKTTAEYIQASSRVGREHPGIVFTFLAPTKNRDRSHYEQFKAFHQAYYYYVESSSVTPFSGPALEKALPTVLIALTRSLFLKGVPNALNTQSYSDFIREVIKGVQARGVDIYGKEMESEINFTINEVYQDFQIRINSLKGNRTLAKFSDFLEWNPTLSRMEPSIKSHMAVYNAPSQFTETILNDHIATMQSLRNVESSSKVLIKS
jgi:hypothetical protein